MRRILEDEIHDENLVFWITLVGLISFFTTSEVAIFFVCTATLFQTFLTFCKIIDFTMIGTFTLTLTSAFGAVALFVGHVLNPCNIADVLGGSIEACENIEASMTAENDIDMYALKLALFSLKAIVRVEACCFIGMMVTITSFCFLWNDGNNITSFCFL